MSVESCEFITLRNDTWAAELSKCPAPVDDAPSRQELEDDEHLWRCRCCGQWKKIPAFQHVCAECFAMEDL